MKHSEITELTDEEINKTIAEFMGWHKFEPLNGNEYIHPNNSENICKKCKLHWVENCHYPLKALNNKGYHLYTTNLDALVPVWEKLGPQMLGVIKLDFHFYGAKFIENEKYTKGKSIQQAAALVTYEAIKNLEEE